MWSSRHVSLTNINECLEYRKSPSLFSNKIRLEIMLKAISTRTDKAIHHPCDTELCYELFRSGLTRFFVSSYLGLHHDLTRVKATSGANLRLKLAFHFLFYLALEGVRSNQQEQIPSRIVLFKNLHTKLLFD